MMMHYKTLCATRSRIVFFTFWFLFLSWLIYVGLFLRESADFATEAEGMTIPILFLWIIHISIWTSGDLQPGICSQFILRSSHRFHFVRDRFLAVSCLAFPFSVVPIVLASVVSGDFSFLAIRMLLAIYVTLLVYGFIPCFLSFVFKNSFLAWLSTFFVFLGLSPLVSKYVNPKLGELLSADVYLPDILTGYFGLQSIVTCLLILVVSLVGSFAIFRRSWI